MTSSHPKSIFHISILFAFLASLLGSMVFVTSAHAAGTITVDSTADGALIDLAGNGACDLREAVEAANTDTAVDACTAGSGDDTILFDSSLSGGTITLQSVLTLNQNVTIDGSALTSQITISGNGSVQVFSVDSGTVTLNNLKITNGSGLNGGGIYNASGTTLTITNSTLSGNSAQAGGGIYNLGLLTITNSTFAENSAPVGGGIFNDSTTLIVTNSTFSGNAATSDSGGGIHTFTGTLTITNSTFSGNSAGTSGGGIYNDGGTLNYANTIIANSTAGGDCAGSGTIGTNIDNLVEDNTCSPLLHIDPLLDSLKDNGGPTQTMALMLTSPAIDAGDNTSCGNNPGPNNLDQRGVARPVGAQCDIGAFEGAVDLTAPTVDSFTVPASATSLTISPIVLGASDNNSAVTGYLITESDTPPSASDPNWTASSPTSYTVTGSGSYTLYPWAKDAAGNVSALYNLPASVTVCTTFSTITVANTDGSGPGSLRQAIADACSGVTINFDASLSGQPIALNSELDLVKNVTIDGSSLTTPVTISGQGSVRVFYVAGGVTATLNSLIVKDGWYNIGGSSGYGGGLLNDGTVNIINSVFSTNTAGDEGGAIRNNPTGVLNITGSTFSGNAAYDGGAIANYNQLTITNSTFSTNTAVDAGGAIYTTDSATYNPTLTQAITNSTFFNNSGTSGAAIWSNRTQTITNSTFSGNVASQIGGSAIRQDNETLNIANTIIANSTNGDCYTQSAIGIHTNNLMEEANSRCAPSFTSNPLLDILAANGGPTQTFALLPGSPAINTGDDATCAAAPVSGVDQRGIARPNGDHCDIGAYEHQDTGAGSVTGFTVPSPATSLNVPVPTFTASDDGVITAYLITESATRPLVGDSGWTASVPTTYTVSSVGSHTLYPWVKDDAENVSALSGLSATIDVCLGTATVTSNADNGAGTLRQAIADACDGGTINFASNLAGDTIHLTTTLDISKSLTIDGSALTSMITISGDSGPTPDGTGDVRVFHTTSPTFATITLNSLSITNGLASGPHLPNRDDEGGGLLIDLHATVNIINSLFSGNSANNGGAISIYGTANIIDSTFSGNLATSSGGGGAIFNSQVLTIKNSTFSGNLATSSGGGGALLNTSPNATIANSTFSGNIAAVGGAIATLNDLTITNSTISGNSAYGSGGGGLSIQGHTTNLINTIIANSITRSGGPNTPAGDCVNLDTIGTNTNNLIEDGSCSTNSTGFKTGDPLLGALANNSGPTQTLALLAGSKAIDAGDDTICAAAPVSNIDQRGTSRLNGGHCDIGAYEYVDTTAPSVTTFTAPSLTKNLNIPITAFTASDDAVVAGYLITGSSTPPLATATGWSSSVPTTYTVASSGSYPLFPWVKDASGHVSLAHASVSVTVDADAPTVVSSLRTNGSANPSASASVNFTVTFFESVTGVSISDFSLTTTGTVTGAAVTAVSGSGTVRTVSVHTGTGDGTIRLNVPATATITDIAGNAINGLPYTSGQAYTIGKTLKFTSIAAQDGWVLESSGTSNRGGTLNSQATTFNLGDDATRKQYRGILSFNTSSIPDNATITGVTLTVTKSAIVGGGNPVNIFQGFMADIKNGFFGTSVLQNTDFQAIGTASYGPFIVAPVNNVYSINLTGGKININKLATNSGLTQIRLRFKLGDNNNAVANYLSLVSGNATNAANRPQLVITYTVP